MTEKSKATAAKEESVNEATPKAPEDTLGDMIARAIEKNAKPARSTSQALRDDLFCRLYLSNGFDVPAAYREAGFRAKTPRSLSAASPRKLGDVNIKAKIAEPMKPSLDTLKSEGKSVVDE